MPGDPGGGDDPEDQPDDEDSGEDVQVLPDDAADWTPTPPTSCPKCGKDGDEVPDALFDPMFRDDIRGFDVPDDLATHPVAFDGFRCRACGETFGADHHAVDGNPICGVPTKTSGDPCQHRVSDDLSCRSHGSLGDRLEALVDGEYSGIPDGTGSGDPGHQQGDGSPPEGNKNAVTHGAHAYESDPWGLLDFFEAERPRVYRRICGYFWDYMKDAPFPAYILQDGDGVPDEVQQVLDDVFDPANEDLGFEDVPGVDVPRLTSKADRLLLVCVGQGVTWAASLEQSEDGLTKTEKRISETGQEYWVEDERPVNMPKARIRRQDLKELKELGVLDDPDSQAADALAGWGEAAQRVAEREADDQEQGRGGVPDETEPTN